MLDKVEKADKAVQQSVTKHDKAGHQHTHINIFSSVGACLF
jgi:hypothetical protein